MEDLPADVVAFYNEGAEIHRVSRGLGRLEFARLTASLVRHFPPAPATIGDVGGGPGVYARWLASRGYAVHLLDPIALHVQQAETASALQPLASCRVGDARELPFENEALDAILLHGPLYHLTERADRIRALTECHRVLRPGGIAAVVAISRFASAVVGIVNGWIWNRAYLEMVREEVSTGQHRRPEGWRVFTTAYFHAPSELRNEVAEAGLEHIVTVGIQGSGWLAPGFDKMTTDSVEWASLLEVAGLMEHEPELSPHMLAVARRAG